MKKAKLLSLLLALAMLLSLAACGAAPAETPAATEAPTEAPVEATEAPAEAPAESAEITVTDLIGREITVTPGSYQRVVCIGAGALRLYSYIGDVSLLCGVEDIDNETLSVTPSDAAICSVSICSISFALRSVSFRCSFRAQLVSRL